MSVYGPNQVEELMIGDAVASETTAATFIAGASDGELAVVTKDGTALAAGDDFYILQKTGGTAAKGLDYEFSDTIEPGMVDELKIVKYGAETFRSLKVSDFSTDIIDNAIYIVKIRILNDGGSLSPENFRHIVGSYVTPATGGAAATIIAGIKASLEASLLKEGSSSMFTITSDATSLTVTGVEQTVVAGKITGKAIEFELEATVKLTDLSSGNLGSIETSVTTPGAPGYGTGKMAVNLEWFTKGYKYDKDRTAGYPVDFNTQYYADVTKKYHTIHVKYKKQRNATSVENQHKVLTILVYGGAAGTTYTAANAILARLDTAIGTTTTVLS